MPFSEAADEWKDRRLTPLGPQDDGNCHGRRLALMAILNLVVGARGYGLQVRECSSTSSGTLNARRL